MGGGDKTVYEGLIITDVHQSYAVVEFLFMTTILRIVTSPYHGCMGYTVLLLRADDILEKSCCYRTICMIIDKA